MNIQPAFEEIFKKSLEWFRLKHGEEKYQNLLSLRQDEEVEKVTKKCKRLTISKKKIRSEGGKRKIKRI